MEKKVKTRMLHLLGADQDTVELCVTGTGICEQLRQSSWVLVVAVFCSTEKDIFTWV